MKWVIALLGVLAMSCQSPAYPASPNTYHPGPSSGGPPYSVTYENTTPGTTGTVPVDGMTYSDGAMVTVMGNSGNLSWSPWIFDGWSTMNGNGTDGGGGGTLYPVANPGQFAIHANVILYGTWHL